MAAGLLNARQRDEHHKPVLSFSPSESRLITVDNAYRLLRIVRLASARHTRLLQILMRG
jgi:hypothetical protein